jgi:hypothetical protein
MSDEALLPAHRTATSGLVDDGWAEGRACLEEEAKSSYRVRLEELEVEFDEAMRSSDSGPPSGSVARWSL